MNKYADITTKTAQSAHLHIGVQYLILKSTANVAWIVMAALTIFVFLFYPADLRIIEIPGLLVTTVLFFYIRFVEFPKAKRFAQLDWISICFVVPGLFVAMINVLFGPEASRGTESFIILCALTSLIFYNNVKFVCWLVFALCVFLVCRFSVGKPLTVFEWITLTISLPWLIVVIRSTVDESSRNLLRESSEKEEIAYRLTHQTEYFNALLERAPLILCVMDENGVYEHSRGSGLSALGLEQNQIVGLHYKAVFKDFPNIASAVSNAFEGKSSVVTADFGNQKYYEIRYEAVVDAAGHIEGVIGVGIDISERIISETKEKVFELAAFRNQKGESITSLASGVAHDLNNQITAIVSFCETLEQTEETDSKSAQIAKLIKQCAFQAAGVSNQMLSFTGKRTDSMADRIPINFWSIIEELEPLAKAMFSADTTLKYQKPTKPAIDSWILADSVLIQQAVINILQNADDALDGKAGTVSVSMRPYSADDVMDHVVTGEVQHNLEYVQLVISDTGCGIAETDLDHIFDIYYTTKSDGHGIGLAVTGSIIKKHGGVIACKSEIEKGTTTRLILPLIQQDSSRIEYPNRPTPMELNRKILVVDDEPTVLMSISMILESRGCEVVKANSGVEALELLDSIADSFDCIVLDYSMPQMNGLTTLQKIRESGTKSPVILCTGLSFSKDEPQKYPHWPQEILTKPFQLDQLIDSIDRACKL